MGLLRKFLELQLAMALWLQPGEEPETAEERADLDAIIALRESAAIELKVCSFDLIHSKKYFPLLSGSNQNPDPLERSL